MKKSLLIAAVIFSISAVTLFGQAGTRTNTSRQVNQQGRLVQGAASGELTRKEIRALENEQKKIQIEKKLAKADGKVTPKEKRFLRREQNRASRHIARQKHDSQNR